MHLCQYMIINYSDIISRFTKRSHHSYESNRADHELLSNDSKKDTCFGDLVGLHKTWLNITKNIDNIRRSMHRIRQGFVTMSLPNNRVHLRISAIEAELSSILEAISVQQKVTGYEYPLGDIMKLVNRSCKALFLI